MIRHGDVVRPSAANSHWLAIEMLSGKASGHTVYAPFKLAGAQGAPLFELKDAYDARTRKVLSDEERRAIEEQKRSEQEQRRRRALRRTLPESLDTFLKSSHSLERASMMALSKEVEQAMYRPLDPQRDEEKELRAKIAKIQAFVEGAKVSAIGKGKGERGARGWAVRPTRATTCAIRSARSSSRARSTSGISSAAHVERQSADERRLRRGNRAAARPSDRLQEEF